MKICPKCGKEHDLKGVYCSRSCANSRSWSNSQKAKLALKAKHQYESMTEEQKQEIKDKVSKTQKARVNERQYVFLMESDFSELAIGSKRVRVILEQDNKCNRCGISEWIGEPITFELEHKDGNRENNERTNLEALCPNCHSLTDTWRGRKNGVRKGYLNRMLEKNANNLPIYDGE